MTLDINRVGKRWFIVTGKSIDVEASLSHGTDYVKNDDDTKKTGYNVWDAIPVRRWTLTGKGARSHKQEIVKALEATLPEQEAKAND